MSNKCLIDNNFVEKGMHINEYLEDTGYSQYFIIHKFINDSIDIKECEAIFTELKNSGLIISGDFEDDIWGGYSIIEECKVYLDFKLNVSKEIVLSIKKFALVKLGIKKNTLSTIRTVIYRIKDMLTQTHMFSLDYIDNFCKYLSTEKKNDYLYSCREFLEFTNIENAYEYYKCINNIQHFNQAKARNLPDYESIILFDMLIRNFIDTGDIKLRIKYYPILMWWIISTIIPLRPSEFLFLKRNCIYNYDKKYFIHIERIKNKYNNKKHSTPIMTEFQIPETIYCFISDFIDYANQIDNGEYLISHNYYSSMLNYARYKNVPKINISEFNTIFNNFSKEVIEGIYGYKCVELGCKINEKEIERIRAGDTRHFAFINMMMQGLNPLYIQRIGGHYTLEEQLFYCNHLDTFITAKTYILSKVLSNKSEIYQQNYNQNIDWGLKITEKELLGYDFYKLPKVKNGMGRCTSNNVPLDCICDECLFCDKFIPEKNVTKRYLYELKIINNQNIEIRKQLLSRLLKEELKDENEISKISLNLATLVNQEMILNAYTLNLEKGDQKT